MVCVARDQGTGCQKQPPTPSPPVLPGQGAMVSSGDPVGGGMVKRQISFDCFMVWFLSKESDMGSDS